MAMSAKVTASLCIAMSTEPATLPVSKLTFCLVRLTGRGH